MKLIPITDFLESKIQPTPGDVFAFTYEQKLFIGPKVSRNFCARCLLFRMTSSVFYKDAPYKEIKPKDTETVLRHSKELQSNQILEVSRDGTRVHHILRVPGCVYHNGK